MANAELLQRAQDLGVDLDRQPADRVVITAVVMRTPLGDAKETWQGLLEGKSGVVAFPEGNNSFVKIAAPVKFNPEDHFDRKELRGVSSLNAMGRVMAQDLVREANLVGEDGKLHSSVKRKDVASWVGSGISSTQHLIDIHLQIHGEDGQGDPERNSRGIAATKGLEIFPEQINAGVDGVVSGQGWGATSSEACATGLSNPVDAACKVKEGYIKAALAGGLEDPFEAYPEVGLGVFAGMRSVLSTRSDEPQRASRPFDVDRDGFVEGAGGALVAIEEYKFAKAHNAPILADVLGFRKSMDGGNPTNMDIDNVARTILAAMWDEKGKEFFEIDAIFAHATSTTLPRGVKTDVLVGDLAEAEALRRVFGDSLKDIPIAAIKSNMGHLLGGAGAVNLGVAVFALNEGVIPHILNLENPDPKVADLYLVRGEPLRRPIKTALVVAYGFGGYNAAMVIGKPEGIAA